MPKAFRGFQLAGELFLLTSFFIEPKGCRFESYLTSQKLSNRLCPLVNCLSVAALPKLRGLAR